MAFCYHLRIGLWVSTAYDLQIDRHTQSQNQTLEQNSRTFVSYKQDVLVTYLPLAKLAYNNSVDASTGVTPFYVKQMVYPLIEEAIPEIPDDGSVHDMPNVKARAKQMVELHAFLEKRWQEASAM